MMNPVRIVEADEVHTSDWIKKTTVGGCGFQLIETLRKFIGWVARNREKETAKKLWE